MTTKSKTLTALEIAQRRVDQAIENRRRMPIITAYVAGCRALFGEVRVTYASENGIEIGRQGRPGVVPVSLPHPIEKKVRAYK